jgi:hypothetical protein
MGLLQIDATKAIRRRQALVVKEDLENMHFCETNRIGHDAVFDVTQYTHGSYDCKAKKVNPVRLAGNKQSALSKHGYKWAEL